MSACLLLDPFQQYLEMSFFFGLYICIATANTPLLGMVIFSGIFFFLWGWESNMKLGLQVIQRREKYVLICM